MATTPFIRDVPAAEALAAWSAACAAAGCPDRVEALRMGLHEAVRRVTAAAAAGATDVLVCRAPVVAVLPTGDEIRPVGTEPAAGVILDTNSLMLVAQAEAAGCEAWRSDILPDDPAAIAPAVRDAAARADLVIVVAGSSAGRGDHTAAIVERPRPPARPRGGGPPPAP